MCPININKEQNSILSKLQKYCGNNITQLTNYITNVSMGSDDTGNIVYKQDFIDKFKSWYGYEPSNRKVTQKVMKDAIIRYYEETNPSGYASARGTVTLDRISALGYPSISARLQAKRTFVNIILDIYKNNFLLPANHKKKIKDNDITLFIKRSMNRLTATLAKRLGDALGVTEEDKNKIYKKLLKELEKPNRSEKDTDEIYNKKLQDWLSDSDNYGISYLNKLISQIPEDEMSINLQTSIALYREYTGITRNEDGSVNTNFENDREIFLKEVLRDERLNIFRKELNSLDYTLEQAQEENDEIDESSVEDLGSEEVEYDTFIRNMENKMGLTKDFYAHIGTPIRALLGSLPKMISKDVKDVDNPMGIADVMDANLCATVLYHHGRYDNESVMLESIKDIADKLPGFAAFHKLYDTLVNDPNLTIMFYSTFKKIAIGKQEVIIDKGVSKTRITNPYLNRREFLKYRFQDALKSTALEADIEDLLNEIGILETKISLYNQNKDLNGKKARDISTKLALLLQKLLPSIEERGINNFVFSNDEKYADRQTKLRMLAENIRNLINAAKDTKLTCQSKLSNISYAYAKNNQLSKAKLKGRRLNEKPIDIAKLWGESYLSDSIDTQTSLLADMLSNYIVATNPLNSRNTEGNQSSDIINSSMITQIKETLESNLNRKDENGNFIVDETSPLVSLGNHRSQHGNKQYDFSNILLEHRDDNGNIINYGLFTKDEKTGNWIPTNYADSLIQIRLFNGSSNLDTADNALYSKMSKGDYVGTAWRSFFNTQNVAKNVYNVADYFMRIPSDAPKNFMITAPRYNVKNLLVPTNEKEIEDGITNILNTIQYNLLSKDYVLYHTNCGRNPIVVGKPNSRLNHDEFIKHMMSINEPNGVTITIPDYVRKDIKENKQGLISIAFRYDDGIGYAKKTDQVYIMEGQYKNGQLLNAKFKGYCENYIDKKTNHTTRILNNDNIKEIIRTGVWEYARKNDIVKYGINKNHNIISLLKNIFMQELTDMVDACNLIFESEQHTDGNWNLRLIDNSNSPTPLVKIKYKNRLNGLHPNYHFKNGKLFEIKDGKLKLTGNVFHSDRFILYDYFSENPNNPDKTIRNFGEELLNECFNITKTNNTDPNKLLKWDSDGNIVLSLTQNEAIENKLCDFVLAYLKQGQKRISEMTDFLGENTVEPTNDNIIDFCINNHIAYIGFNDLFEGDSKFYKDSQTFLKRAKEAQGSGVPYGAVALQNMWEQHSYEPLSIDNTAAKALKATSFVKRNANGDVEPYEVNMYNTFRGITVKNTKKTDNLMIDATVKTLTDKDIMGENYVLTEEEARKLMNGFGDTKVNDAQSYITFDEWIRRITLRGQLPQYKELIDRILDETQPLTVSDIQTFVQVQKNFYYDQYYNPRTGKISPRQIKNAEFVLIPRLIKGTDLQYVEQIMRDLGIDQLNTEETSKAGQSEIFELWDNDGHINKDVLKDVNKENKDKYESELYNYGKDSKELYNYSCLYTQQETPQHMNSENKAAIQIMKKLTDNIDENSAKELQDAKRLFTDCYTANIKESFINTMKQFNVSLDNNDNIIVKNGKIPIRKLDDEGNVIEDGISYEEFFKAVADEITRKGYDSNLIDYCELEEGLNTSTRTKMPNYFGLLSSKMENICQALFNSGITRQTLPGFHAAQVTGMGFRKLSDVVDRSKTSNDLQYHPVYYVEKSDKNENDKVKLKESEYNKLSKEEQKNYERKQYHYIEVRLPASNFGFDIGDETSLKLIEQFQKVNGMSLEKAVNSVKQGWFKQLQKTGLDEIIGYRIPTEGKQSVCSMKVVDFTDDSQGSTIIVPDGFVSQTGSDFDIDSVYGIQYSTYIDKYGNIQRIEYIEDKRTLYENYVKKHLTKPEKQKIFNDSRVDDSYKENYKKQFTDENGKLDYDKYIEKLSNDSKEIYTELIDEIAKEKNLLSYEEYDNKYSVVEANTREARNNKLLDCAKTMLIHPQSLVENLSRSNFEELSDALDWCRPKSDEIQRSSRSPYNIFDQADYQEDAMSGARLKGISVVRDTTCSVCNTMHTFINPDNTIKVFYDNTYDYKKLKNRFNNVEVIKNNKNEVEGYVVTHDMFGWSKDNKNVDGFILTSYSSQTTAHILDAIKTGNVPNVNEFTFQVYKIFPDIGSNYKTAVSFIMQPAIKRIVDKYNKSNSIYSDITAKSFILDAAKDICEELGLDVKTIKNISDLYKFIKTKYDIDFDIPLNAYKQKERLNVKQPTNADLLYDLQIIYKYNQLNELGKQINDFSRVSNPDKFGAKQTLYQTRDIFEKIKVIGDNSYKNPLDKTTYEHLTEILNNEDIDLPKYINYESLNTILTNLKLYNNDGHNDESISFVNKLIENLPNLNNIQSGLYTITTINNNNIKVPVIDALYPNVTKYETSSEMLEGIAKDSNFINNSKYRSLAAFLKYSTASSILINSELFITQSEAFRDLVSGNRFSNIYNLRKAISGNSYITEKMANDFQKYVVNYVISQSEFLKNPLSYIKGEGFDYIGKESKGVDQDEIARIHGYGYPADIRISKTIINDDDTSSYIDKSFIVNDINNPTQEELDLFAELSPAQKVQWLQNNFRDSLVFKYFNVRLFNESNRRNSNTQTISFNEQKADIETVRTDFELAFSNRNPLLALGAADLIKYSFIVEGYNMKMQAVSKTIPNSVLMNGGRIFGTNIVHDSNEVMYNFAESSIYNDAPMLVENFIRSHPNSNGITQKYVKGWNEYSKEIDPETGKVTVKTIKRYELNRDEKNMIIIPIGDVDMIEKYNLNDDYVKLKFDDATILYKVYVPSHDVGENLYLIPLNPLASNEYTTLSAIDENNLYEPKNYYIDAIELYEQALVEGFKNEVSTELGKTNKDSKNAITSISPNIKIQEALSAFELYRNWQASHVDFNEEEHIYSVNGVSTDYSVTQFCEKWIQGFNSDVDYKFASAIGRTIDKVTRDYFIHKNNKRLGIIDDSVNPYINNYDNLNDVRKNKLLQDLERLDSYLQNRFGADCHVITNEIPLAGIVNRNGEEYKIAGTPDMIVIDSNGDVHILDMKAKRNQYSKHDELVYTYQLNAYKRLLETLVPKYKGKIKSLDLIYFEQVYPKQNKDVIYKTDNNGKVTVSYRFAEQDLFGNEIGTKKVSDENIEDFEYWRTPSLQQNIEESIVPIKIKKDDVYFNDVRPFETTTELENKIKNETVIDFYNQNNNVENTDNNSKIPLTDINSEDVTTKNDDNPQSLWEYASTQLNPNDYAHRRNISNLGSSRPIGDMITNPNNPNYGIYQPIVKEINNWYNTRIDNHKPYLFIRNLPLGRHIFATGLQNGIYEEVPINGVLKTFRITKVNPNHFIKKYTGKNIKIEIAPRYKQYEQLINLIREIAVLNPDNIGSNIDDLYAITEVTPVSEQTVETMSSTIEDVASQSVKSMYRRAYDMGDKDAGYIAHHWRTDEITSNKEKIANHVDDVIITTSKYVTTLVHDILDKHAKYIQDETGTWRSIDDDKTIQIVKKNPKLRNQYFKDLQEPAVIYDEFKEILALDIDSQNESLQPYLKKMKESIAKVQNLSTIANAKDKFVKQYYDKLSTHPLINDGHNNSFMSVLSGFYRSNYLNSMFNDIQEVSNPLVQIALKNFQVKFEADMMQARKLKDSIADFFRECRKQAKAEGKTFDLNHVIDEYGQFKQKYTQKLIEDRDKLKAAKDNAKPGSLEYLKAKLEYDEWKAKYLEQEVVPEYYNEKNKILRRALYGESKKDDVAGTITVGAIPNILEKYEILREERKRLREKYHNDIDNPELIKDYARIDEEIHRLTHPEYYEDLVGDDTLAYQATRLNEYIDAIRKVENKYFKYVEGYNFEELLRQNLDIINSFEASGNPKVLYKDNPKYVAAKNWISRNVIVDPDIPFTVRTELDHAKELLRGKGLNKTLKSIFISAKYKNPNTGEFDPTLVPKDVLDNIKNSIKNHWAVNVHTDNLDRTLLSNATTNKVVYTKEFYDNVRGGSRRSSDPEWLNLVTSVNNILSKYYDDTTGEINIQLIPQTKEGLEDLQNLVSLYAKMHDYEGTSIYNKDAEEAHQKWLEENVDRTSINDKKYLDDSTYIKELPRGRFKTLMYQLIDHYDEFNGEIDANRFLYGQFKPKDEVADKWIDKDKTKAFAILDKYTEMEVTEAYQNKRKDMLENHTAEEYKQWIEDNHIYNPFTHKYELLPIWTKTKIKSDKNNYFPKFAQSERVVRDGHVSKKEAIQNFEQLAEKIESIDPDYEVNNADDIVNFYFKDEDFRNDKYIPNAGHGANYKVGSNPEYDNKVNANDIELKAATYIQDLLVKLAKNNGNAETYFKRGGLPARAKLKPNSTKGWVNEILKTLGYSGTEFKNNEWYENVNYANDKIPPMPMIEYLKDKGYQNIPPKPKRKKDQSDMDYANRLNEWEEEKNKIEKENKEIHKALLDRDWENVIQDFIIKAGAYNSIQESKSELFFVQDLLKEHGSYVVGYDKHGKETLLRDRTTSTDDQSEYIKTNDEYLQKQYENYIRRIVYNQFKQSKNTKLLKWMSVLQNATSASYMMMNVKGGIANVTVGNSSIRGEMFAKEFFGFKEWLKGKKDYMAHVGDYILHSEDDKAGTLEGAIIKFMSIVDYSEHAGIARQERDPYAVLKKLRDYGYTPQTAGEHMMQNSVLFTMMESHRLFLNPKREEFGQPKYIAKNFHDFTIDLREEALKELCTDDEWKAFEAYRERISKDANEFKDFAWFRQDFTTNFVKQAFDNKRKNQFIKKIDEIEKKKKEIFYDDEAHPTIKSQLELGKNGKLSFKKTNTSEGWLGSIDIEQENGEPSDAFKFLADFKRRVISVNKYIHGAYDKSGMAQLEKTFIGSLIMQYHKHLPIGIMKRYRLKGMWSEERGAVSKGMYTSLIQFLSIPFRKQKNILELNDEEVDTLEGVQNIFKNIIDFVCHFKLNYRLLPEYDKANIRRMGGSISGILAALFVTIATKAALGADDDDEGLLYNMALYQADRLATEAGQYFPPIFYTEAKKIYQSPIAANSGITDALGTMSMLAKMIIEGDEFDDTYKTGKFAGESKLSVYIQRRIPIWRGIRSSFIDISKNNKYYKVGDNFLSFFNI